LISEPKPFLTLGEVVLVDLDVETGKQVLKDNGLDDSAFDVIDLFQSLNYLHLLSVEVVKNHTRRYAASIVDT
jgi:hypothetical protein